MMDAHPGTSDAPISVDTITKTPPRIEMAAVRIPRIVAKRSGSFENFEGVPSRFDAVLAPARHVVHAADVFAQVAP